MDCVTKAVIKRKDGISEGCVHVYITHTRILCASIYPSGAFDHKLEASSLMYVSKDNCMYIMYLTRCQLFSELTVSHWSSMIKWQLFIQSQSF